MTIVGLNFTKIIGERKNDTRAKINISNNVSIANVEESSLAFGVQEQKGLKVSFVFTSTYDPDFGVIELHGNLMYLEDAKKIKDILAGWQKDKKLPQEAMKPVLNAILNKCNVQALVLSRDVSLPPPVPLPRVNVK